MEKKKQNRYRCLDTLRGGTLISMILYHTVWDIVYIEGVDIEMFHSPLAYVWQQSICWTFILLSGFCWNLGSKRLKRGGIVFVTGILVSLVTEIFIPQERILFGVLTLLGSSMLLMIPLEKVICKIPAFPGMFLSATLFLITKPINNGYLGMGEFELLKLPSGWYDKGYLTTFLGFTDKDFFSSDYFSLFPWFFLFLSGYFIYRIIMEHEYIDKRKVLKKEGNILSFIGQHSLLIYLVHQPAVYLVMSFLHILLPK